MRKRDGITLVALIITIVILLILAVVTINTVSTDGIINKTELAVKAYKQAELNESQKLGNMVEMLNKYMPPIKGDANGDGLVTIEDRDLLRKYLQNIDYTTGESTVQVHSGADANGDGTINGQDLLLLNAWFREGE